MTQIQTSYYGNLRNNSDLLFNPICISIVKPFWLKEDMPSYNKLMPTSGMLKAYKNNEMDIETYFSLMNHRLSKLDPKEVLKELKELVHDDKFTLMCYEKPSNPNCHRHVVGRWLTDGTGIKVVEAPNPSRKK